MASNEQVQCDVLVIGAGVVGLAVAARMSPVAATIVVEKYSKFGQETSSRNSEVVHSGIYYPKDSLKTELCIRGRGMLYDFCSKNRIPHSRCGKFVVATQADEIAYLEKLEKHCKEVGVEYVWKNTEEVLEKEPLIHAKRALFFPWTGIVDSHALMQALETQSLNSGASLAYRHKVLSIHQSGKSGKEWVVETESEGTTIEITAQKVVNCAGLSAATFSNEALGTNRYEHRFCRGRYFVMGSKYHGKFSHLIYPIPPKDGLGVHVTLDMEGAPRLGPDVEWVTEAHYECDWDSALPQFVTAVQRYLPKVTSEDLAPGLIGIRPKLFVDGIARPDFLIEDNQGFVHCLGIESPGLTSALAIAERVAKSL